MIRICKELEEYPELTFKIEQIGGGVLVTFSSSEGVNSLYQCIKDNPGRRIPDYSKTLNVPVKTLERWVQKLRGEQKIIFKGSPKKGGYYPHGPKDSQQ